MYYSIDNGVGHPAARIKCNRVSNFYYKQEDGGNRSTRSDTLMRSRRPRSWNSTGHGLRLVLGECRAEVRAELFEEERNALAAPAAMADGILHRLFARLRAVVEKDLQRVGDGALVRIEVVHRVAAAFLHHHPLAQAVDARVPRRLLLVVLRAQVTEDERHRHGVLDAVVAVGGVVQRAPLVDDPQRRFLGPDADEADPVQPVPHVGVQRQRRFDGGLGVELRRERHLEEDVLRDVRAPGPAGAQRLARPGPRPGTPTSGPSAPSGSPARRPPPSAPAARPARLASPAAQDLRAPVFGA